MKKIKILIFLSTGVLAGFEKMMYYLVNNIDKEKFDVTICVLYGEGIIAERLINEKHRVILLRHDKRSMFKVFCQFFKLLKDERFDILYLGGFKVNMLGRIPGKLFNCKIITAQRSVDEHWSKLQNAVDNFTTGIVDLYISNTIAAEKILIEKKKINKKRIKTIYNGIEIDKYITNNECWNRIDASINESTQIICIIANLIPYKGHEYFFECISDIEKSISDFCAILIGDGEYRKILEDKVNDLGINDRIKFLGIRKDIPQILKDIDVLVLPSLFEGMPNVIMEAMASKKPVVATNVGGIPELVIDGETGYLVSPKKPKIMAEKLIELLKDENKRINMGEKGFNRIQMEFSISKMVESTEKAFTELLKPE